MCQRAKKSEREINTTNGFLHLSVTVACSIHCAPGPTQHLTPQQTPRSAASRPPSALPGKLLLFLYNSPLNDPDREIWFPPSHRFVSTISVLFIQFYFCQPRLHFGDLHTR